MSAKVKPRSGTPLFDRPDQPVRGSEAGSEGRNKNDWTDDLRRTYDAMGGGKAGQFLKTPKRLHCDRPYWLHPDQVSVICAHVDGLSAAEQATLRRIGF